MTIYPAIDIKDGKCVRLLQGDFDKQTVYAENPVSAAEKFVSANASFIHIVDLDAARTGRSANTGIIKEIIDTYKINVQTGGGIRSLKDVENRLEIGVSRVIIGTAAIKDPEMVKEAVYHFGDKIAVGIDAKNGFAAISGWEDVSPVKASELALQMKEYGIKTIIYTDIETDGMMSGTNINGLKEMIELTGLDIIASGGISTMNDLAKADKAGAKGAIIGQALYKGALDLAEVLKKFE